MIKEQKTIEINSLANRVILDIAELKKLGIDKKAMAISIISLNLKLAEDIKAILDIKTGFEVGGSVCSQRNTENYHEKSSNTYNVKIEGIERSRFDKLVYEAVHRKDTE